MKSRTILITGVTRGLGGAMAEAFLRQGHRVLGCGRSKEAILRLQAAHGPPHDFAALDVRSDRAVADWSGAVAARGEAPDLLVNNAALINRNAALWRLTASEFDEVIDVNLKGVANVIRHFLPLMIARGSGVIVNFSSGWGRSASPEVAPYCATKWGIEGLTQALAQELPSGLGAVALNPGIIDTEMLRRCFGPEAGVYPSAEEWASRAVPFLLGLEACHNGQSLAVPG